MRWWDKYFINCSADEAKTDLVNQLESFARYENGAQYQYQELKWLKHNLNSDEVIIHFFENSGLKHQDGLTISTAVSIATGQSRVIHFTNLMRLYLMN